VTGGWEFVWSVPSGLPLPVTASKERDMPRKKLVRHFEPRYGVSREMVDVEATYVAREHQDYLALSTADLCQKLYEFRGKWMEADQTAEQLVGDLPERDALAFQCLLVRDLYLVLELYGSCLKTKREELGPQPLIPAPATKTVPTEKALPFSE
jgi:hypothetical protein